MTAYEVQLRVLYAVLAILVAGCTSQPETSPAAFCDQLERSEARLQLVADEALAQGSNLANSLLETGAIVEYQQMLDELVDVAPSEINAEMTRARDTFASQVNDFLGDGASSNLEREAIGRLLGSLADQAVFDDVDAFSLAHCSRDVFAFMPPADMGSSSDVTDSDSTVREEADVSDPTEEAEPSGTVIGHDLNGNAWYSSEIPTEPLAEHELPFVQCDVDSQSFLWALDPEEGTTRPVLQHFGACDGIGSLVNTQLTHDGRYLVSPWESAPMLPTSDGAIVITDVETGESHLLTTSDISARINASSSEGLDATSTTVDLTGFDASNGGTVYFGERRSDNSYVISLEDVLDPASPPPRVVERRFCHSSFRFNSSGTRCIHGSRSSTSALLPEATEREYNSDIPSMPSRPSRTYWINDQVAVGATNGYDQSIWKLDFAQGSDEKIVEIRGDRSIDYVWHRSVTGQVYFTSRTLDEQGLEIYQVSLEGDEPVLVATLPASYEVVPLPS